MVPWIVETSLHRQLKQAYANQRARLEAPLGRYRIDVARDDELIEIQHGSLAAIREKVRHLLQNHRVLVVKPIVRRKQLVKQDARGGRVVSRRLSPRRGREIELFDEMVFFTRVFPHPNLTVEVPLVDVEEWRYPGHGRRRWRRGTDYVVEDQRLVGVHHCLRLRSAADLLRLIPGRLPSPFHTAHLASALNVHRRLAQRIAYCLRTTGAVSIAGKDGNALLYQASRRSSGPRGGTHRLQKTPS